MPVTNSLTTADLASLTRRPFAGPRVSGRTLNLYESWPTTSAVIVSAEGDIDASNAGDLDECVRHAIGRPRSVVLDLSGVDFFALAGLSVLIALHRALAPTTQMAVVPSRAVNRVLGLCSPAPQILVKGTVGSALATVQHPVRPMLHLLSDAT
jgi:anti-anti-sigma factor